MTILLNRLLQSAILHKNKHDIIEPLEEGLTKDLILLGIDLGKIYACYEDYKKQGIIPGLEYDAEKDNMLAS